MPPFPRGPKAASLWFFATGLLPLLSAAAAAEPVAGNAQPDRIDFGKIFVGATVEASARIFFERNDATGSSADVHAPPFVQILRTQFGTQNYGNRGTHRVCDVFMAIDTSAAGELKGDVEVEVGGNRVRLPVAARVAEPKGDERKVLIAETPFQRSATDDASLFDPWLKLVNDAGLNVSCLEVEPEKPVFRDLDLANFDVVLLAGTGLMNVALPDHKKLKRYVYDGGRLILTANYFFRGTVEKTNKIVQYYALDLTDEEPPPGNNLVEVGPEQLATHRLTAGVARLKFFRPSPVALQPADRGAILVAAPPFPGKGLVALGGAGRGEIVVLGDSLWWNWLGSPQTAGADNAVLLKNLMVEPCGRTP